MKGLRYAQTDAETFCMCCTPRIRVRCVRKSDRSFFITGILVCFFAEVLMYDDVVASFHKSNCDEPTDGDKGSERRN